MALHTGMSTYFDNKWFFSQDNYFYTKSTGLVGQCTWYCWSKAHVKADAYPDRNIDAKNLPISGAHQWIADTKNNYEIGDEPRPDSIAVWKFSSTKGHVAYIEDYNSSTGEICYSEANWYSGGNPSWEIYVPSDYLDTISYNVNKLTDGKVTVYSKTPLGDSGKDGLFQNSYFDNFKTRKNVTCQFIYLRK